MKNLAILYRKLWIKIAEIEMKRTDLKEEVCISSNTLAKLGKNEYKSLEVLEMLCRYLHCDLEDIEEINYDEKLEEE